MPIQDLGPSEMGRRGLDRAQDAIEAARSKHPRTSDGLGDAAGTELHKASAAGLSARGAPAAQASEAARGDSVELSVAARALHAPEDSELVAQRSQRVADMRRAVEAQNLATPERAARAAERLLGG